MMAGKKGKSGGKRPNAGRKPTEPIFSVRGEWTGYEVWRGRKYMSLRSWTLYEGMHTNVIERILISKIPCNLLGDMQERIENPFDSDYAAPRGQVLANYIARNGEKVRKGYVVR